MQVKEDKQTPSLNTGRNITGGDSRATTKNSKKNLEKLDRTEKIIIPSPISFVKDSELKSRNKEILKEFLKEYPQTEKLELMITDNNGCLRGKHIPISQAGNLFDKGIRLSASVFSMDIRGDVVEESGLGNKNGDMDFDCYPIAETLVPVPWKTNSAQVLLQMVMDDGKMHFADPRNLLNIAYQRILDKGMGLTMAMETEFYLLDPQLSKRGVPRLAQGKETKYGVPDFQVYSLQELDDFEAFTDDVEEFAEKQNISIGSIISESSPCQLEVDLKHKKNPFHACDDIIMIRRIIKQAARKNGYIATFMAQPFPELDGNGAHIHMGIYDKKGGNIFANMNLSAEKRKPLRYAVGGILDTMEDVFLIFAPHVNSYKRFKKGYSVSVTRSWGTNNRTVALRVVEEKSPNIHLEHRLAGADVNPYLLAAAVIAGACYGLDEKVEPPAPVTGDAHRFMRHPKVIFEMQEAMDNFRRSSWVKEYFGEEWRAVYSTCKQSEFDNFRSFITELEYEWYLSSI